MADEWDQFPDASPAGADPWAQFPDASPAPVVRQASPEPARESFGDSLKRGAGVAGRAVLQGVAAVPLLPLDAGIAIGNLINRATGQKELAYASDKFNQALNQAGVPEPQGFIEKAGSVAIGAAVGSRLPAPGIKDPAPKGFTKLSDTAVRDATLKAGQDVGLRVPPSTTNPSGLNRALETIGGKVATAQDASTKNQKVFNELARKALDLKDDTPLTPEMLSGMRAEAGKAYQEVRKIGSIPTDTPFRAALAKLTRTSKNASRSFPGLGKSEIDDVVSSLNQKSFDSGDAIDAISILRDNASKAYSSGDKALGRSYREASGVLEDMIERHLARTGASGSLNALRSARQLIAKTYSVENALNSSTGNIIASKLASQLSKGKPLSGELKLAAQFAQAFPKAAQQIIDSGSVRNTDLIVAGGTAALSQKYQYLLYPFLRQAVRAGMLSKAGQSLATKGTAQIAPRAVMGAIPPAQDLVAQ